MFEGSILSFQFKFQFNFLNLKLNLKGARSDSLRNSDRLTFTL